MEKLFIMQMPIVGNEHAEVMAEKISHILSENTRVRIETYVLTEDFLDLGTITNREAKKDVVRLLNILLTQGVHDMVINNLNRVHISGDTIYLIDGDDLNCYEQKMVKLMFENYFSFTDVDINEGNIPF